MEGLFALHDHGICWGQDLLRAAGHVGLADTFLAVAAAVLAFAEAPLQSMAGLGI